MYQPYPSSGQPVELLRPPAPAPVLSATRFMYGGAVGSAAYLIAALPFMGDIHGKVLGYRLTAAPLTITLVIVVGLAVIALWLWMARATSQGRNWARILSTVLFGLATLELTPYLFGFGEVFRRDGVRPDLPSADLAGRLGRGVAAVAPGLQRVLQAAGHHAGRVRRSDIFADPVVPRSAAASVVSHVDLRARADVARRAPDGLPDRAGTLLVTVVTLDPM